MEKRYIHLLNVGDDYLNKVAAEKRNLEIINILMQMRDELKTRLSYLQGMNSFIDGNAQKREELSSVEKQIEKLSKEKMSREEMEKMIQSAELEIDSVAKERAEFIGHCKSYINLRKAHARDLKNSGVIAYLKVEEK